MVAIPEGYAIPVLNRLSSEKGFAKAPHSFAKHLMISVYWPNREMSLRIALHLQAHIGFRVPAGRRVMRPPENTLWPLATWFSCFALDASCKAIRHEFALARDTTDALSFIAQKVPHASFFNVCELKP